MTMYYTQIYMIASHKKQFKKCLRSFIKKTFSNCQATYQIELYLLFKKQTLY